MKEVDPYTYGDFEAAVTLAKMVNKERFFAKRISKIWVDYTLGMNQIEKIDSPIKRAIMTLWKDSFIKRIHDNKKIPEKMKSYLSNIVIARFRISMNNKKEIK